MAKQLGVYKRIKEIDLRRLAKFGDGKIEILTDYVLGRCVPSVKTNAAKILVNQLVLDKRLNTVSANVFILQKLNLFTHTFSLHR